MKRLQIAVLALGLVAALALLAGCGSSSSHGEEGTLTLIEPASPNAVTLTPIGNPGKSFAPGSGATVSFPLESSGGETVGELKAVCFATQPSSGEGLEGTCSGTAVVPGGTFALSAGSKEIFGSAGVSGAVTGGTGKYNGALGSFTSKPTGKNRGSNLTFNYILP